MSACRVIPVAGDLRVRIEGDAPARTPEVEARIDAHWAKLSAALPKLFNGPVVAVREIETGEAGTTVFAVRDEYRRLVAQPGVPTGVQQLSVTGLLVHDGAVCVAQRSAQTRIYAGLWELAPSGGVDVAGDTTLCFDDLVAQLAQELDEELGVPTGRIERAEAVALVVDGHACSTDVVIRAQLRGDRPEIRRGWEYDDALWVEDIDAFVRTRPVIPPTAALLGWMRGQA